MPHARQIAWSTVAGCILLGACQTYNPATKATVAKVYVLRHAERLDSSKDSPLSATGKQRAEALADLLESEPIEAIYATPYRRTQMTVAPLARRLDLLGSHCVPAPRDGLMAPRADRESQAYSENAKQGHGAKEQARPVQKSCRTAGVRIRNDSPSELARYIRRHHPTGTVVVAGHSNTIPPLIAALGGQRPGPIEHDEYGDLWEITLKADEIKVEHRIFGSP